MKNLVVLKEHQKMYFYLCTNNFYIRFLSNKNFKKSLSINRLYSDIFHLQATMSSYI